MTVDQPRIAPHTFAQRIIVPLDLPSAQAALDLVDAIPQVSFWKLGLEHDLEALTLPAGTALHDLTVHLHHVGLAASVEDRLATVVLAEWSYACR